MDWLRTVPSRWEVGRLKRICRFAYGDSLSEDIRRKGNVPVFGSNGPVGFHVSANTNAPCIVVGRKGSFGKVNYSCTPVFAIDTTFFIDPRYSSADIRWLYYLLGWLRLDDISRDSAVPGLNREESYRRLIPIPPRPEQTAIARLLDHAVHRIRRYISAKRKLIALLNEQRQTMISQVITGQIDVRTGAPYSAYKPSGIPWLGEVPSHWFVAPLKRYCHFRGGTGFPISAQGIADEDVIFAKVSDMNREGNERSLWTAANSLSRDAVRSLGANIFGPNSIVFPKVGGALLTNKRRVIVRDTCIDNNLMGCTVTGADPGYVFHLLSCIDLGGLAKPGPVPAVSERDVREIRVTVPPHREQMDIARFLEDRLSALVKRRAGAVRQVEFVSEYRDRLVADLVTGKLDARWGVHAQPKSDHGVS